jgi:hypothetical protein
MKPVGVAQVKAGPGSAATDAFDRGVVVAPAGAAGVVVGGVVVVVDDVRDGDGDDEDEDEDEGDGDEDEDVVEADATVVTATVVTTMSALKRTRTISLLPRRLLECNPPATAAKRRSPAGFCGL